MVQVRLFKSHSILSNAIRLKDSQRRIMLTIYAVCGVENNILTCVPVTANEIYDNLKMYSKRTLKYNIDDLIRMELLEECKTLTGKTKRMKKYKLSETGAEYMILKYPKQ